MMYPMVSTGTRPLTCRMQMDEPFVSIVLRSFNEGWALRETLAAVMAQDYRNWELIVIDSGSTDGSPELIRQAKPREFLEIHSWDYNPARVMNWGMRQTRSDFGIFINADATPVGPNWLRPLVEALQDRRVAAVFGRQVPRPDCRAVFAHDYERCFGPARETARWDHFFSMVSSGIRKDVWAQRGFDERFQYSEDDEYTRWCRSRGFEIRYVPASTVVHSHNYTMAQAYKRAFGEGRALAWALTDSSGGFRWPARVGLGWLNDVRKDLAYCLRQGRLTEWPHATGIRWQKRKGSYDGFCEGRRSRPDSRPPFVPPSVMTSATRP